MSNPTATVQSAFVRGMVARLRGEPSIHYWEPGDREAVEWMNGYSVGEALDSMGSRIAAGEAGIEILMERTASLRLHVDAMQGELIGMACVARASREARRKGRR